MRRVLACFAVAALALLTVQSAAVPSQADPDVGPTAFGQPVIQEFATRGAVGVEDEFITIMNPNRVLPADINDWMVIVYDCIGRPRVRFLIPEGTVLDPFSSMPLTRPIWTLGNMSSPRGPFSQYFGPGDILPDGVVLRLFDPWGC
jgi:hypothetical protein